MPPTPIPPAVQPPIGGTPPGNAGLPQWLATGAALLIVGAFVEVVYHISPNAAYLIVLVLLLGFASVGGRMENLIGTLQSIGILTK